MADVVWLTRHGSRQDFVDPDWHTTADRPHDPPLSKEGLTQATQLSKRLQTEGITAIFSSPFLRCVQTAATVADHLDLPVHLEYGFSEWLNPDWFPSAPEILTFDTLSDLFPAIVPDYVSRVRPVYPESGAAVLQRTVEAATAIAKDYEGDLVFVGHGATVYGSVVGLLGRSFDQVERTVGPIHFCCLFKLTRKDGVWVVDLQADTSHLSEGRGGERFK